LERAVQTANGISAHNISHPEVEQTSKIVEHYWGTEALKCSRKGQHEAARYELAGSYGGAPKRDFRPRGGGESYKDVGERARDFVENEVLGRFGVALSEVSKDLLDEQKSKTPDILPEGIPHVVLVSHNLFLTELYEGLLFWNKVHKDTRNYWANAAW
jgi:broad specificity phosphatase PhoE